MRAPSSKPDQAARHRAHHLAFAEGLASSSSTAVVSHPPVGDWLRALGWDLAAGVLEATDVELLRHRLRSVLADDPSLLAHPWQPADPQRASEASATSSWDLLWRDHPGARAARARHDYYLQQVDRVVAAHGGAARVLDLGPEPLLNLEGPALAPDADVRRVAELGSTRTGRSSTTNAKTFDLIWSAGRFDYLDDDGFVDALVELVPLMHDGAEAVFGHLAADLPTRSSSWRPDWKLFGRSPGRLRWLAREAAGVTGIALAPSVRSDPTGMNLFLHCRRLREEAQ